MCPAQAPFGLHAVALDAPSSLKVACMSFFDIVLDFILMDAFEDLENPPSSVLAVLRNRWLSDSFKETVGARPFPICTCPVTLGTPRLIPGVNLSVPAH